MSSYQNPFSSYWSAIANNFTWQRPFQQVNSGSFSQANVRWFDGGWCNIAENCLDRHLAKLGDHTAIIFEPNNPDANVRKLSYRQLYEAVCLCANGLKSLGIVAGDRVCIYMPMCPEGAIAMLACARIGAVHSVVFAGFSAESLADRMNDAKCKLLITADAFSRGEKKIFLKKIADEAMLQCATVKQCLILNHSNEPISIKHGRDLWWHEVMRQQSTNCPPEPMRSEDPLFILYTSGSTGKPKGLLHTTAGYMVYVGHTFRTVFCSHPDVRLPRTVIFCTADIGWITGHSYLVYGPLLNGATTIIYEGIPTYPDHGRLWDIIDKHSVEIFYTAPTAIRALEALGTSIFENKNLNSLKVLGSVGEPINEEAWRWYHQHVGKGRCPIVDTWWQTETGGILISAIAGVTPSIPTYATLPLKGIVPVLLNDKGVEITTPEAEGNLCIKEPWPAIARTVYGNHDRYKQTYLSKFPGYYFTGDGARRDAQGNYRITGRVDDVINVSGHRIGTGEVEDAINHHLLVVESAVVGYKHHIKGEALYAFVIATDMNDEQRLREEVSKLVCEKIGSFARPEKIQLVSGLPKTRSGKIMRRILRKIAEGDTDHLGDTTTLLDPLVVESIIKGRVD